ncbi:glycoside-pentoside-hexuronide (GPH):cation symporter [Paenibacillus sp. RC67]|uniref:MFS transporter n=1 Tax=Paenibacillus sp. RC67 TaxID=3039392 RepID=UPI0024ADDDAC|nr:glycoside-pentoside-hexuronide (GPH):cation symporter [Paenibacillus sp. RC67]
MNTTMEHTSTADIKPSNQMRKFGIKDKVGYMFGDIGNDLFFGLIGGYLMLFYTDVYGISAAAAGMILLIARVLDAAFDVAWGAYVDSKPAGARGKFRPYLLYCALPVTLLGVLTFTYIPVTSDSLLKVIVAAVPYILWGLAYSTINIPYGSLASVMTSDPIERTGLSTFRTLGALLANVFIMVAAPSIVFSAGKTPTSTGFLLIAIICAVLANLFYFGSYKFTVERVRGAKHNQEKTSILITVKGLLSNRPLLGLMLASFGMLASMLVSQAITPYLFKDYFKNPGLIAMSGLIGLGAMFVAMPVITPLVKKYGKKETASIGLIITFIVSALMFILPITNAYVYMTLNCISNFGLAFMNILIWAMVADCIDYQEKITGRREEGTVYSVYSLVRKIGQAVAGGIGGFALVYVGYNSGAQSQTVDVAQGIKAIITLVPAVGALIALLAMILIYNLTKSKLVNLNEDLIQLRIED